MNVEQGLKVARKALEKIEAGRTLYPKITAADALRDTASIEQPEVASVDSAEFRDMLHRYARDAMPTEAVITHIDAHCAQQVAAIQSELDRIKRAAACGTVDSFLTLPDDAKRNWFVMAIDESKMRRSAERERDELRAQLAQAQEELDTWIHTNRIDELQRENNRLLAQLAARIEPGEPVAGAPTAMIGSTLQKLGARLAALLDDDDFNNIEPYLNALAALQPSGQPAGQFGTTVTAMIGQIRASKSMAHRDSLIEGLMELIEPSPVDATQPAPVGDGRAAFEAWCSSKEGLAGQTRWDTWQASAALHRPTDSVPDGWQSIAARYADWMDEAADDISGWGAYASEYFQEKHELQSVIADYRGRAEKIRAIAAAPKHDGGRHE